MQDERSQASGDGWGPAGRYPWGRLLEGSDAGGPGRPRPRGCLCGSIQGQDDAGMRTRGDSWKVHSQLRRCWAPAEIEPGTGGGRVGSP